MSQSGFTPILLYGSTTTGNAPLAANLTTSASGVELAINAYDGKLFYKDSGGVVQVIATKGTGTIGGSNTQVQYNSSGALAGSSNLTFDGTTLTANALTLTNKLTIANGGTNATATPTAGAVAYGTGSAYAFTSAGTTNQVLVSNGASAPTWSSLSSIGVTTFSAGTTGFTPNSATSGAITLAGTLATTNGGTGLTSFTANGVVYASSTSALTTGSALTFDGTNLSTTGVFLKGSSTSYSGYAFQSGNQDGFAVRNAANNAIGAFFAAGGSVSLSSSGDYAVVNGSSGVIFGRGVSEDMRLTSTGLGIGTSSPLAKLHVKGATNGNLLVRGGASAASGLTGTALSSINDAASATVSLTFEGSDFNFVENNAVVAKLDSSGNLGLGVTPSAWWSSTKAIQIGAGGVISGRTDTAARNYFASNAFLNSTPAWTYISTNFATRYEQNDGQHQWFTAPSGTAGNAITFTQAMTLTAAGRLGLGLTSPSTLFEAYGGAAGTSSELTVGNASTAARFGVDTSNEVTVATGQAVPIKFLTSNTERARIDSSGNLGLGVTPPAWSTGGQIAMGSNKAIVASGEYNNFGANWYYSGGYNKIVTGYASNYYQAQGAHIWQTAGTGSGTFSFTQAMTLDASGNLGIGTTTTSPYRLNVLRSDGKAAFMTDGSTADFAVTCISGVSMVAAASTGVLALGTSGTERARIDSSGNLLVGTTSATGLGVGTAPVQSAGSIFSGGTNAGFAFKDRGASTFSLWYKTGGVNYFYTSGAGANVASINETTGAYTALSDVSKKKDFEESMIGLDTVMQLQPKLFRMLSDEDTAPKQLGFIAQDVKSVLPQAYVEQKDEDNTFIGLQDRPFIAALVKAIQEQQALITQLTERITALESK